MPDVDAIERATVAGVAPAAVREIDGWLVPRDAGVIGRAKSAVPLAHDLGPEALDAVEAAYRQDGLPPAFRIADVAGLEAVRDALAARGYAPAKPTLVMVGDIRRLAAYSDWPADILTRPDAGWADVFTSEGFDPAESAIRVAALARSPDALYASVRRHGRTLAVGVASFHQRLAAIHGMRTVLDRRGEGLAGRVLTALGVAAQARDASTIFLQVETSNPARRLYEKAGFKPAWTYAYWTSTSPRP